MADNKREELYRKLKEVSNQIKECDKKYILVKNPEIIKIIEYLVDEDMCKIMENYN